MGRTLGDPLLPRRRQFAASDDEILAYLRWQVQEYGHAVIKEASIVLHVGDVKVGGIARANNIAYSGHGVANYVRRKPKGSGNGRILDQEFIDMIRRVSGMTRAEKLIRFGGEYRANTGTDHTYSTGGTGIRFNGISQPQDVEASMLSVW